MGIRETLNRNPAITTGATIGIIVLAIIFIISEMLPSRRPKISTKVYFSDDDGTTFFASDAKQLPPFMDENGKEAVRAFVYNCKGQPFVGYLLKYSPDALKLMSQTDAEGRPPIAEIRQKPGQLVKKPGATNQWVDMLDQRQAALEIMNVKCTDGTDAPIVNP